MAVHRLDVEFGIFKPVAVYCVGEYQRMMNRSVGDEGHKNSETPAFEKYSKNAKYKGYR
jgi:hypothetical protein